MMERLLAPAARALPLAIGALLLSPARASATGFTDVGQDLKPRPATAVKVEGYFRTRGELLSNLDLDRGLSPSGQTLFPVPEGGGQNILFGDMRLRTDLAVYSLGGMVAVKARIDVLDNVAWGGSPAGVPSASTTQRTSRSDSFVLKRAYGEVALPIGVIAAGRMGAHWGLGMLANGGDCLDCDSGDAQDRIAYITPLAGHIWAAAYDHAWSGPTAGRRDGVRRIGVAPSTQVHGVTFAFLKWNDTLAHDRRRTAGKITFNYGAYVAHRWQGSDAPYEYLSIAQGARPTGSPIMARGFRATAFDAWLRLVFPHGRIELEAAAMVGTVDQPSLVPGVRSNRPVTSTQIGLAVQTEIGAPLDPAGGGLDLGYASGDSAYGFGASNDPQLPTPARGDLEGPQANLPYDRTVDNFRFHPDYRIDRILFRELIGTVTDAWYLRPHARVDLLRLRTGRLQASVAGIASWAIQATSTPSGKAPLGVEIDPTVSYVSHDGFTFALEYAAFFPGGAFDNPRAGLAARNAQLFRVRLGLTF
ncbi:MAG: TIGR04551 family protein [Deltaproteobacteria bacterium]|nr:TIGR04551 family protein [Deltaproteobacteria bacterium]